MSFVFYDTETTGINTSFDQILQFAAIRTDDQLNELEAAFEIRSRLLPHIVPSPGAMRANRVTVHQLTDETLPSHYEMVRQIRQRLLAWSPAVFIGYNSIEFDEHLLRQAFYKTLHPPYMTNTNGNVRCDALRLMQAASVFAPDAIAVAVGKNGRSTYRLDRLAPANGFAHEHAHDALADVRATIHLCRLLMRRAPEFWTSAIQFTRNLLIIDFVATAPLFGLTDFYWGRAHSWIVSMIGSNGDNSNEIYLYNLAVDPERLTGLSQRALCSRCARPPKPIRRMRANALPILSALENAPPFAEGFSLGSAELQRRANFLRANSDLRLRLIAAFEAIRESREPSPHIEEQIYGDFFSDTDEYLMEYFHSVPWRERFAVVETFEDSRLREIGYRLIHCERPDLLDRPTYQAHTDRIARSLLGLDGEAPWLTLREAIREANDLLETREGSELTHIAAHRDYLQRRLAEAMRLTL